MLDFNKYSEEEFIELSSVVFTLADDFKKAWEAEPFQEPDILEFLERAEKQGNEDVRDELGYVLEVYINYFAPEPKLSEEQYRERLEKVKEFVGLYEQSTNDGTDGPSDGGGFRARGE